VLSPGQTTARNPETSETYEAIDSVNRATNPIVLPTLDPQSSVDADVWMQIPEGVETIDLYLENTQAFQGVPIEN
jgi:hypothetical protein